MCTRWPEQDNDGDPERVPPWIRAHFVMEERWGELEAEYYAAAEAVQLAEAWGTVRAPGSEPKEALGYQYAAAEAVRLVEVWGAVPCPAK